uniref:Uncharacterized protein n=1 Tax=Tanacetum cinerariifolium TaxID=118510 RepID=A0A6L2LVU4_TANCI|nr:hypothetical protein [Tanacetum cinerariifolium]
MSDMIALLNDLSYIPLNNEQNEPTQGDIDKTSNEPTRAKRNEFEELYSSANEELYLSCDYVTRLDFMAKFTYFKVKSKLTDSIFNEMLEFFQHVFLTMKGYKLPPSYYQIKKTFKMIGLGYESIHACVNDCFLFRGDNNKDVHFCLVCKTSRWKDSNTPRKKVPKKVLRYFLIILRLQRLYKSSHTAKEMTWHVTGKYTKHSKMQHLVDGRAWKNFDTSPKSPGKDIDVYLRALIDDLKVLWALKGVETIDIATGYKACPTCNEDTLYVRVLGKTAYVGHIRFLKKPHKWRRSLEFNDIMHIEKNVLEAILKTLLMNDKSKDTAKARQDLKRLGIRCCLWLRQTKNEKCSKPQVAYPNRTCTDVNRCYTRPRRKRHAKTQFGWKESRQAAYLPGDPKPREMPLYYPSWQKVPAERKAAIVTKIWTQFDLKLHLQSQRWTDINTGIHHHLQKLYNTNKASLKAAYWVINPETGTYDVESIRKRRPENITLADWDAKIAFWNDPRNQARTAQNRQNCAKSKVVCRQGSRSLARLRDQMMESSATREYPSLIHTFFVAHTVGGVFTRDEDRAIYEEMLRLQALGSKAPSGVPYTEEEINALARKGKQRGHLPGVDRALPGRDTDVPSPPPPQCTHNSADVEKLKKKNKCGDDEMADDEDGSEDEDDEEDGDS